MRYGLLATVGALATAAVLSGCGGGASSSSTDSSTTAAAPVETLPINSSGLLAGNATPTFPAGQPGQLAVMQAGPVRSDLGGAQYLPVAIRNNTTSAVSFIRASASATNASGTIIATGANQEVDPQTLEPGAVGLSFIYFQTGTPKIPATARFSFQTDSQPPATTPYGWATLKVTQANRSGTNIVGQAANTTGAPLTGPYAVNVYCFNAADRVIYNVGGFTDQSGDIAAGGVQRASQSRCTGAAPPTSSA